MSSELTIDDFERIEIRAGRIQRVEQFPEARKPAYKLWIDFGDGLGLKSSSAQITELYDSDELAGRMVVAVVNFPPLRIAGFASEVRVLGVPDEDGHVVLLRPDRGVPIGGRVY